MSRGKVIFRKRIQLNHRVTTMVNPSLLPDLSFGYNGRLLLISITSYCKHVNQDAAAELHGHNVFILSSLQCMSQTGQQAEIMRSARTLLVRHAGQREGAYSIPYPGCDCHALSVFQSLHQIPGRWGVCRVKYGGLVVYVAGESPGWGLSEWHTGVHHPFWLPSRPLACSFLVFIIGVTGTLTLNLYLSYWCYDFELVP